MSPSLAPRGSRHCWGLRDGEGLGPPGCAGVKQTLQLGKKASWKGGSERRAPDTPRHRGLPWKWCGRVCCGKGAAALRGPHSPGALQSRSSIRQLRGSTHIVGAMVIPMSCSLTARLGSASLSSAWLGSAQRSAGLSPGKGEGRGSPPAQFLHGPLAQVAAGSHSVHAISCHKAGPRQRRQSRSPCGCVPRPRPPASGSQREGPQSGTFPPRVASPRTSGCQRDTQPSPAGSGHGLASPTGLWCGAGPGLRLSPAAASAPAGLPNRGGHRAALLPRAQRSPSASGRTGRLFALE